MSWAIGIAFVLGATTWSLAEYVIHRWAGHDRRFVNNPFGAEHTAHHGRGNYFAPTWKKLAVAAVACALLIGPAVLVAGPPAGSAYVAGFVAFYGYYETLHRLEHVWAGVGPYARWARKHHFFHHFHDPSMNHGVTTPIWDHVFGTYRPVDGAIRVPEKLAMAWVVDPATGEVWENLAQDYELRKSRKSQKNAIRVAAVV